MGFLDRIFGSGEPEQPRYPQQQPQAAPARTEDEQAIERYRYLLRTAPPETIEQVHAEAFAKLTDEQRAQVLADLSQNAPAGEAPRGDDPQSLARAATRAELRQPGTLERSLGAAPGAAGAQGRQGPSFGSMVGSSLLGTVAGYVIGSALVSAFMAPAFAADGGDQSADASGDAGANDGSADSASADAGGDAGGDWGGGGDFGGGDFGGDFSF